MRECKARAEEAEARVENVRSECKDIRDRFDRDEEELKVLESPPKSCMRSAKNYLLSWIPLKRKKAQ